MKRARLPLRVQPSAKLFMGGNETQQQVAVYIFGSNEPHTIPFRTTMREAGRRLLRRLRKLSVILPLTDFEEQTVHRPSDQPAGASPNSQGASVAKCLTLIASDSLLRARHSSYCGSGCSQLSGERPNALGNRIAMSAAHPCMAAESARRAAGSRGTSHSRNTRSRVSPPIRDPISSGSPVIHQIEVRDILAVELENDPPVTRGLHRPLPVDHLSANAAAGATPW